MKKRIAVLAIVFCLAATGAALWPVPEAAALPCKEFFCEFYSDDTYQTWVGYRYTLCGIGVRSEGQITPYKICWHGDTCGYC